MAISVGCHVRDAGVWKPTEPHARGPISWFATERFHAKASSVWKVCFTDLIRSLTTSTGVRTAVNFDFSAPYSTQAGLKFNVDGTITRRAGGAGYSAYSDWLTYDTGLWAYDVWFSDNFSHNLDTVPTLGGTRLPMSSGPYTFESVNTTEGTEEGNFDTNFVDNLAPGPAPVLRNFTTTITAENGIGE